MPSYNGPDGGVLFTTVSGQDNTQFRDRTLWTYWGLDPVPFHMIDYDPYTSLGSFEFWPRRSGGNSFSDGSNGSTFGESLQFYGKIPHSETGGGSSLWTIQGLARDSGGLPKGNCRAILRRSVDDAYMGETYTDGSGIYGFEVQDITTNYYVEIFQAAPPLAGVSIRTLTGTVRP